jgi:RNA polymerase sigma factor (sigma-70 family)
MNIVDESDEVFMEQFCAGDERAFSVLFERHAAAIRGYLLRLTGNGSAAEDLTQVSFLSVVRARGRFLPGARFKPWLYAIATNAARDWQRRGRHEVLTEDGAVPDSEVSESESPDSAMQSRVRSALEQLPQAQREAIVLHRFEGLSFAEVAEAMGVSESAAKVRAHRGYERLRELLKGVWSA